MAKLIVGTPEPARSHWWGDVLRGSLFARFNARPSSTSSISPYTQPSIGKFANSVGDGSKNRDPLCCRAEVTGVEKRGKRTFAGINMRKVPFVRAYSPTEAIASAMCSQNHIYDRTDTVGLSEV
jgi:hypothetical protein